MKKGRLMQPALSQMFVTASRAKRSNPADESRQMNASSLR